MANFHISVVDQNKLYLTVALMNLWKWSEL